MTTLARQQGALLQALWAPSASQALVALGASMQAAPRLARGLKAYRAHARELAVRALAAAYPRVAQRLGDGDFAGLARQLWQCEPPVRGDVAQWGEGLAGAIEAIPALAHDHPGLADLARVEWLLHRAAVAADAHQDAASLQLLLQHPPDRLRLRLAPGTAVVGTTLVWRDGLRPRARDTVSGEAALVAAGLRGRSLADALEAAAGLELPTWLAEAWRSRLLLGVAPLPFTGDRT